MDEEVEGDAVGHGQGTDEALVKRKRLETYQPQSIDVTKLNGKPTTGLQVNNHNRFAILANLEIENDKVAKQAANNLKTKTDNRNDSKPAKTAYCPPIFLYNVNIKHLVDQLEARTPKILFKIKNVNRNKSKLYIADLNVYTEMMALLREKNINSYSFTPKELRQVSLIIRGLYSGTEADEIKMALEAIAPGVVDKVSKYTTSFSVKKNIDTGLYLISLSPGKSLTDVSHIKYLLSQTIIWEKPKKKDQDIQCRRCQQWGHIARNCNRKLNCVKCDKTHEPGNCARKEGDGSQPSCVNCRKSGHPASWRGCPFYKDYVNNRKARMKEAREKQAIAANNVGKLFQSSRVSQGVSFASVVQAQDPASQYSRKPSPIIAEFLKLANLFNEPAELSLEQQIENFLKKYRSMPKNEAKIEFLRLLNKVKNSYDP